MNHVKMINALFEADIKRNRRANIDTKPQKSDDAVHTQSKHVYFLSVTVHTHKHITITEKYRVRPLDKSYI